MLDHFQRFLYTENLDPKSDTILIGISGGVDSVVLAHLFIKFEFKIALAHVNYGQRGVESDKDEELVRTIASAWGVTSHITMFPDDSDNMGNFQENARNFRYQWFDSLVKKYRYKYIAVAHHADDQIETFLMHLMRASGVHGLSAMQQNRDRLIRPLLSIFKEEIYAYAERERLEFREDASNQNSRYRRNYLRNEVIPHLVNGFPNAKTNILKSITLINESVALTEWLIENSTFQRHDYNSQLIDIAAVGKSPDPIELLFWIMRSALFTISQLTDIWKGKPGAKIESGSHMAIREQRYIRFFENSSLPEPFEIQVSDWGEYVLPHARILVSNSPIPKADHCQYFELRFHENNPFPLTLRRKKSGDIFKPKGMQGKSKTVKQYLSDQNLDFWQRNRVVIIETKGIIAGLLPHRISHLFEATQNDNRVYVSFTFL